MKTSYTEASLGALLLRQLASLIDSGADIDSAATNLRQHLSDPMRDRLDGLVQALKRAGADGLEKPKTAFEAVMKKAHAAGADMLKAMLRFTRHYDQLTQVDTAVKSEMQSRSTYLVAVGIILVMVLLTFVTMTVPEFVIAIGLGDPEVGRERMPALTRILFVDGGGILSYLLIVATAVPIIAWLRFSGSLRNALQTLEPIPGGWMRWPLVGRIAERANYMIAVMLADSLRASGLSAQAALEASGAALPSPSTATDKTQADPLAMALARETGQLESELDRQAEAVVTGFLADFRNDIQRFDGLASILLGILVGLIVVGMYIPIFNLGSATI